MEKICSVLIPSRNRFDRLMECSKQIFEKAANPNAIEILVRIDRDDPETYKRICEFPKEWNMKFVIGDRYRGYKDLYLMYDELCKIATGEFFWLYNDDVDIQNAGWDNFLQQYKNKVIIIHPFQERATHADGSELPIFHRKVYDIIGHFGQYYHIDDWYRQLVEHIIQDYPNFLVKATKENIHIKHFVLPMEHIKDGICEQACRFPPVTTEQWTATKNDGDTILEWLDKNPGWKL